MGNVYNLVRKFKNKYSGTVAWRLKKHAAVIESYLNPDEEVIYAFCGQKGNDWRDVVSTCVVALTNKRLLIAQKRVVFGSFYSVVTPDLYNDMQIYSGLFYGRITIDTVKEKIDISNLSKKSLDEIETNISEFMMKEKQKYVKNEKE